MGLKQHTKQPDETNNISSGQIISIIFKNGT